MIKRRCTRMVGGPAIVVSEGLHSMLRDQVVRVRERDGREVDESDVLDEAINRCLDTLERAQR